ncbi:MAG: hypothetical protein JXR10_02925 [Cyclobacteriaceae bacterium]
MKFFKLLLVMLSMGAINAYAQEVGQISEFKTGRSAGNSLEKKMKKAPKKVFINSFSVNYQILYTDWEATRAGMNTGKTSAELTVAFEGMDESDFQRLTDDFYDNYVAHLNSLGYETISPESISGHKAFKKNFSLVSGGTANYDIKDGYITTMPSRAKFYLNSKNKSQLSGKMGGIDAVVIDVNLIVPFMEDSESGASKLATKAVGGVSKVVASPNLRISPKSLIVYTDPAVLSVVKAVMTDPVTVGGVFQEEKFKASSAAQTNTSYNLGHVTRVYSNDVNTSKIQVATGDVEKYKKGVSAAMNSLSIAANEHFISYTK